MFDDVAALNISYTLNTLCGSGFRPTHFILLLCIESSYTSRQQVWLKNNCNRVALKIMGDIHCQNNLI